MGEGWQRRTVCVQARVGNSAIAEEAQNILHLITSDTRLCALLIGRSGKQLSVRAKPT